MAEKTEQQHPDDVLREKNLQKRAALKSKTAKAGGYAFYRCTVPHYRQGGYFLPGSIVRVPVDEEPSITWDTVDAHELGPAAHAAQLEASSATPAQQMQTHEKKRPSDKSL